VNILSTIQNYFGTANVKKLEREQDFFRCVKTTSEGIPYEIIYIDYSDSWRDEEFGKKIEPFLTDDYYEHAGYLQWNFYYCFIDTPENIQIYTENKKRVENDESYARKFVMSETGFEEWLMSIRLISSISTDQLNNDLYSSWINFLREHKLYFVYNEKEYPNFVQWVTDYINGIEFNDVTDEAVNARATVEQPLTKIQDLNLLSFRKQPETTEFVFGRVNLIEGPNATGKTSLFDAIELIITGESNRDHHTQGYSLEFTDVNNRKFSFPDRYNPYKQRDISWYKSAFNKGHNLNNNFKKFNYYASDTAVFMKLDDDRKQNNLEQVIADIALGRELNRLEERIIGFRNRFETEAANISNEETQLSNELAEKNTTLESLKNEIKDPENYKAPLLDKLKSINWIGDSLPDSEANLIFLESSLQSVSNNLSAIIAKSSSFNNISLAQVQSQKSILEGKVNSLNEQKILISTKTREATDLDKKIKGLESTKKCIEEFAKYFKHPEFSSLIGLSTRLVKTDTEISKLNSLIKDSPVIKDISYLRKSERSSLTINQAEEELDMLMKSLVQTQAETERQINQLESGINELSKIISNIKSQGLRFVEVNPAADNCPLCNTPFEIGQLLPAIEQSRTSFANSGALLDLKHKEQEISRQLTEQRRNLETVQQLKYFAIKLYGEGWRTKTYDNTIATISETEVNLRALNNEFTRLTMLQYQFIKDDLSEQRLTVLQAQLSEDIKLPIKDIPELEQYTLQFNTDLIETVKEKILAHEAIQKATKSISEIFDITYPDETSVRASLLNFKEMDSCFSHVQSHIALDKDENPFDVKEKVIEIMAFFETYKNAFNADKEKNKTIKYIEDESQKLSDRIKLIGPRKENSNNAFNLLDKLLTEQNKNDFLSDYIQANKEDISAIFKLIHSPSEFKEIKLENNQLFLIPLNGQPRELNEISAGQRTALAVSVFLSLNKKLTNGPDIILFDDPVTYVDDLNTLSFLDYLRELVLQTNRQLFFATANNDLAFLFKKKFEFLGELEFKKFPLTRAD
jgi:DNA repair exonuclease SbcCD ATPase subunit